MTASYRDGSVRTSEQNFFVPQVVIRRAGVLRQAQRGEVPELEGKAKKLTLKRWWRSKMARSSVLCVL